jgi:hypothetical protein
MSRKSFTVADLDGDGQLEILVQTFDHGLDIFTVPGSGCGCLRWTMADDGPLRMGAPKRLRLGIDKGRGAFYSVFKSVEQIPMHLKMFMNAAARSTARAGNGG